MSTKENSYAAESGADKEYVLRLYITGASPNSARAVNNIKQVCEKYISGRYLLEIIDVYQEYDKAIDDQIIALPLLIKKSPGMERRLIGDMSDTEKVLRGLGILTQGIWKG